MKLFPPTALRLLAALALVIAAAAAAAGPLASTADAKAAAKTYKKAIFGPAQKPDGASAFPIYRDLGIGVYQFVLLWDNVATSRPQSPQDPNDPAYVWPKDLDFAVKEAKKYRMQVSLLVMRTPKWANGDKNGTFPPTRTSDYTDFLTAAATRYPAVRRWMVWGEPIRFQNWNLPLTPPGRSVRKGLDSGQKAAVRRYAKLLDASYRVLKRRTKKNLVIGGNTTTTGDIRPFDWIRNLRLSNGKPPRMDLYGHNPFGTRRPDLKRKQTAYGTADFSDLDTLVRWVDRYLARSGRNRKLKLYLSEYNAPTDKPSFEFNYHLTRKAQAQWIKAGFKIVRNPKNRIASLGWFGLYDIGPREDGSVSNVGLIDGKGRRKPGYYAFKRG